MSQQQEKKIITVFGATGKQGGAVISALKQEGKYQLRGVARSRDKKSFQDLVNTGVEMINANIATGEGLDEAFKGAYAVFLITASFDVDIEGKEYECGRLLVDKAKEHSVKILVWSTLPHAQKLSGGKYYVPHFTEKAKVEEYIREMQGRNAFESAIYVAPSFYYQNFKWKAFSPKKDTSGCFTFELPQTKTLTACDVRDIGPLFVKLLQNPKQYNGRVILLEGEQSPPQYFVDIFEKMTGKKACLKTVSKEDLEKCADIHHSKQLAEMFSFMDEYTYFGQEKMSPQVMHAREIYPQVKNWETYLRETGWKGEQEP
jgi:uncharacterized protein YbjT (DUF2867 family)